MINLDKLKERTAETPDMLSAELIEILMELDEPDENLTRIAELEDQLATLTATHEEALAAAKLDYDTRIRRMFFGEGDEADEAEDTPEDDPTPDPDTDNDGDVDVTDIYELLYKN